jgi:hypothetical protein
MSKGTRTPAALNRVSEADKNRLSGKPDHKICDRGFPLCLMAALGLAVGDFVQSFQIIVPPSFEKK